MRYGHADFDLAVGVAVRLAHWRVVRLAGFLVIFVAAVARRTAALLIAQNRRDIPRGFKKELFPHSNGEPVKLPCTKLAPVVIAPVPERDQRT